MFNSVLAEFYSDIRVAKMNGKERDRLERDMVVNKVIFLACVTCRPYVSSETTQTGSLSDVTLTLLTVLRTRCGTVLSVKSRCWAAYNIYII